MYADYTKLWKLLIDKGIKKTELAKETGISSRTLAKLSKNQSVTTDTLARICKALDCGIEDILEFVSGEREQSLYGAFINAPTVSETEYLRSARFSAGGIDYFVSITKEKASVRNTRIDCREEGVIWESSYSVGHLSRYRVPHTLGTIKRLSEKNKISVLIIKGKPEVIKGLDEGVFRSVHALADNPLPDFLYVVSESALKFYL